MSGGAAAGYCPYCGDEDLRPTIVAPDAEPAAEPAGVGRKPEPGAWECRSCARVFSVRFLGLSATLLEVKR
jgi:hypothetical protein